MTSTVNCNILTGITISGPKCRSTVPNFDFLPACWEIDSLREIDQAFTVTFNVPLWVTAFSCLVCPGHLPLRETEGKMVFKGDQCKAKILLSPVEVW